MTATRVPGPFEFRKVDGIWQRRRIGPGNRWETLALRTKTTTFRDGRRRGEHAGKTWTWV